MLILRPPELQGTLSEKIIIVITIITINKQTVCEEGRERTRKRRESLQDAAQV